MPRPGDGCHPLVLLLADGARRSGYREYPHPNGESIPSSGSFGDRSLCGPDHGPHRHLYRRLCPRVAYPPPLTLDAHRRVFAVSRYRTCLRACVPGRCREDPLVAEVAPAPASARRLRCGEELQGSDSLHHGEGRHLAESRGLGYLSRRRHAGMFAAPSSASTRIDFVGGYVESRPSSPYLRDLLASLCPAGPCRSEGEAFGFLIVPSPGGISTVVPDALSRKTVLLVAWFALRQICNTTQSEGRPGRPARGPKSVRREHIISRTTEN